jgi:hypothetical protein
MHTFHPGHRIIDEQDCHQILHSLAVDRDLFTIHAADHTLPEFIRQFFVEQVDRTTKIIEAIDSYDVLALSDE